jgi:hypothetical protein
VNHKDEIHFSIKSLDTVEDNWTIELVNNSGDALYVKELDDFSDKVTVSQSNDYFSADEIQIRNNLTSSVAAESQYEHWYKIIVEIKYQGTVYEVVETTIGM